MDGILPCSANQTRIDPAGVVIEGEGDPSRRAPTVDARAEGIWRDAGLRNIRGVKIPGEGEYAGCIKGGEELVERFAFRAIWAG